MGIFAQTAPAYYAKGIPVIPLHRKEKRPVPLDWSRFHDMPVEPETQEAWINGTPDGNIGIVLGKQSGVVMMDIDTEDQALISLIQGLLPKSPWIRIGQKGMVLAFRYTGMRTFRIKNVSGESICELLSERTQCVLPPSIHPKTQQPYKANCELLSVIDNLPSLEPQIEAILRGALEAAGVKLSHSGWTRVTDYVSSGSRDVSMTEKAGLFAYAVMRGERSLKEAIGMLRSYQTEFIENVAGDEVDVDKHIDNMIKFLHRDVFDKNKALPEGWDEGLSAEDKEKLGLQFDKEHEEWSFEEMRDYLRDEFERHPEQSTGRSRAVDYILDRIGRSNGLNRLEEDRLMQYMVDTAGLDLRISSLRNRLRDLRAGDLDGTDHSQIAEAVIKDLEQLYELRYHNNMIWKWTGSHWEVLDEREIKARISSDYGQLPAAKKANDHKGILETIKVRLGRGIKTLDVKGVNFANGFLTEELVLMPHSTDYGMTYTLPFRYLVDSVGASPMFFQMLEDCWSHDPDYQQKVDALQEALCVTLFGMGPRFQRAILLKGVAKSGKSQLLTIALSLVPDNAKSFVPPNEWADRFMPTQMNEKLINVCGELSETKKIDGQRFKDIIDGAEMSGQHKGRDIFNFRPMCTHWFASNHTPKTTDSSEGFNRRWLILEFTKAVSAEKRKINIGDIIVAEEREAISAWAVLALGRLVKKREYTLPDSHRQLIREIAQENNSVRFFIEESPKIRVVKGSESKQTPHISETKLFSEYWSFCFGPGNAKPVSSKQFRNAMRELQNEKGFNLVIRTNALGAQEAFYEFLILAD